jgi:hypothetical protein
LNLHNSPRQLNPCTRIGTFSTFGVIIPLLNQMVTNCHVSGFPHA